MSDIEISEPFNAAINSIPALGAKLKSTPADARLTFTGVPQSDANKLKLNLTLAGFVKVEVRGATVVANTPKYQLGTAQSISSRNLIDPSELLTAKDKTKPDAESLKAPCGPPGAGKKKRACAGCTCGLKEIQASEDVEKADAVRAAAVAEGSAPKSACGSCYLGDAFRCGSCPYLGMPAFKPGEANKPAIPVTIDDDTMDI